MKNGCHYKKKAILEAIKNEKFLEIASAKTQTWFKQVIEELLLEAINEDPVRVKTIQKIYCATNGNTHATLEELLKQPNYTAGNLLGILITNPDLINGEISVKQDRKDSLLNFVLGCASNGPCDNQESKEAFDYLKVAEYIIEQPTLNLNNEIYNKINPLCSALKYGFLHIAGKLIAKDANLFAKKETNGQTPLEIIMEREGEEKWQGIVKLVSLNKHFCHLQATQANSHQKNYSLYQ